MKASLTDSIAARAAKPVEVPNYIIWDSKVPGFGLRVGATSRKWIVYYRNASGTQRKMVLGSFPTIGTDKARKLARGIIGGVAGGSDPAQERIEERRKAVAKVGTLLDRYLEERTGRGLVAADQEDEALRYGFGEKLLGADIASIDRRQLSQLIENLRRSRIEHWMDDSGKARKRRRGGAGAAGYFRKSARTFLDWCVNNGMCQGNPLAGYRLPKRTKAERLAEEEKGRALPSAELARIWIAAGDDKVFHRLVRFTILTGCRRDEGASLQRDWIDRKARTITVPAWLTKMGRDHVIPITTQLSQLLDQCPKTASPFVFPASRIGRRGRKPGEEQQLGKIKGWSKLKPKIVKRAGVSFTLHDFRRSLKTHVRELGFDQDIASLVVGHARDSFEARYDKSELLAFRRKASEAYAGMITETVRKEMGKVVVLKPGAA